MTVYRHTRYDDCFARIASRGEQVPCSELERTMVGYLVDDLRTMILLFRRSSGRGGRTCDLMRPLEQRILSRVAFLTLFMASRIGSNPALAERYLAQQEFLREVERLALDLSAAVDAATA